MKTKILFIFLTLTLTVAAQGKRNFPSFTELTERKWQEISTKANLTDDEKKAVYPIFLEYENANFELNKTMWDTFRSVRAGKKTSENINFAEINDLYIDNEVKQATLTKNYHEKLKKLLAPEKLFDFYMAERNFKRNLMHNIPNKNKK